MIRLVKRKDLDIEKYDKCILHSKNKRIYAYSFYLDIVANSWIVLVKNDYEYVMPIPVKHKYLVRYTYNPCWVQQLGVFSEKEVTEEIVNDFVKSIPKYLVRVYINFNSENFKHAEFIERTNFILPLNKPYEEIFKKYKYVRRRLKSQFNETNIKLERIKSAQPIIDLFIQEKQAEIGLKMTDYERLNQLSIKLFSTDNVEMVIAKNVEDELLGGAIFLKDSKRITYLFSSLSKQGRDEQVMTFIIDSIIEKHADSNLILDFEGSMILGIAFFFKSFGAVEETYFNYQKSIF